MRFGSFEKAQADWRAAGLWNELTLPVALAAAAESAPTAPFVLHREGAVEVYPLSEVHALGRNIAGALQRAGICRGDVVAVQLPNSLENSALYQGILLAGAVVLPLSCTLGPADLTFILSDSQARMFIVPDQWRAIDFKERVRKLGDLPCLAMVVMLGGDAKNHRVTNWSDLIAQGQPFSQVVVDPDDLAFLMYTSGTTSNPKGVMHSSRSLLAELNTRDHFREEKVLLSPWPTGSMAATSAILAHIVMGLTVVMMDKWDADAAADLLEVWQVGGMQTTPFHLSALLDAAVTRGRSLATLKGVRVGATTVPEALMRRASEMGVPVVRSYGSTEHPSATQGVPHDELELRILSDGRPLPGSQIRIVDDDGHDVPPGSEGEVLLRGPEQFKGYLKPELNEGAFLPERWFKTGDIGRVGSGGHLTITDRKKDIIIRGGQNISSREIEDLLLRLPAVADAAAIAVPDLRLGERVCAVVVLKQGMALSLPEIDGAFQAMGIARHKTPEHLEFRDELPRTPTGKVRKNELRAEFVARERPRPTR